MSETSLLGEEDDLGDEALNDLLDGITPEERDKKRWIFDPDERPVRVVVRLRDYRILEVRPKREGEH